ncbi:hypothetical protein GQ53DRAFT_261538 [Thozetella sp. PMI_491]|nr:hypothetical protein GQ53DRAFT_261538 [Thozetella sp. PMI_491]
MAISWGTIQSLVIFFGPIIVPRFLSYYRKARNAPRQHGLAVRPAPPPARRALFLLAVTIAVFLALSLPVFSPENLFQITQSRLQIPVDVLFNRLSSLRPNGTLTATDSALRAKFVNLESRLLYLQFGPSVLAECPFCTSDDPKSYFYYALLDVVLPHVVNLAVLGLVTSPLFAGRDGAVWRTTATMTAVSAAVVDVYYVNAYNYQSNSRALRLGDVDFFYWRARVYRALTLAAIDAVLALLVWLTATNRAFVNPPTPAERVQAAVRAMGGVKGKISAVGVFKNTVIRDEELKARSLAYWSHEGVLMREVMEDREVIDGVNDALENRVDVTKITVDAQQYADNILQPLMPAPEPTVVG